MRSTRTSSRLSSGQRYRAGAQRDAVRIESARKPLISARVVFVLKNSLGIEQEKPFGVRTELCTQLCLHVIVIVIVVVSSFT
jgi:hypothetical protein